MLKPCHRKVAIFPKSDNCDGTLSLVGASERMDPSRKNREGMQRGATIARRIPE